MEMLLTSSKRSVKMPERRWSKAWASMLQQRFKVFVLDLIGRSWYCMQQDQRDSFCLDQDVNSSNFFFAHASSRYSS